MGIQRWKYDYIYIYTNFGVIDKLRITRASTIISRGTCGIANLFVVVKKKDLRNIYIYIVYIYIYTLVTSIVRHHGWSRRRTLARAIRDIYDSKVNLVI